MTGRPPNFWSIHVSVGSIERSYSQNIRPSAKKFLVRSFCFDGHLEALEGALVERR